MTRTSNRNLLAIAAVACIAIAFGNVATAHALDISVTSTADDGSSNTLREAIESINAEPLSSGPHTISFRFPAAAEPVISLQSALPAIQRRTTVDGRDDSGSIGTEIDGSEIRESADGIRLEAPGSELVGVSVYGFSRYGVTLAGSAVRASRIGTSRDGLIALPNREGGVLADAQSTVGGPNGTVLPCSGDCNIIGPNRRDGVFVAGSGVTIINNHIGVDRYGARAVAHGRYGVHIPSVFGAPIANVTIGRTDAPNVIANTGADGVRLVNSFGGALATRVRIAANLIFNVAQADSRPDSQPISLGQDGVLLNDAGDTDSGPNGWINTPLLVSASADVSSCELVVDGIVRPGQTVQFFVAETRTTPRGGTLRFVADRKEGSAADLDATTATYDDPDSGKDSANRFSFRIPLSEPLTGAMLNSLAIDANGNTSTISAAIVVTNAEMDSDSDGLSDIAECALGTLADNEDSDGDGLLDGEEVPDVGVGAPDTDGNNVIDALDPDDDGDGIPTKTELLFGDVSQLDADGDGLPAYLDLDSDNDGVFDVIEWAQDNAQIVDSDSDGLVNLLDSDADADGLCDGNRDDSLSGCARGEDRNVDGTVDAPETDSRVADTDGDGVCDGPLATDTCSAGPDNCPLVANADQLDTDGDGRGDACTCGDGFVDGGESCDDGNTAPGDGCSATCDVEPGATCDASEPSVCTCTGDCATVCFSDEDRDGFTGTAHSLAIGTVCDDLSTMDVRYSATDDGDCNDRDWEVFPSALEYCDGQDTDCNGLIGSADPAIRNSSPIAVGGVAAFADLDADDCGDSASPITVCSLTEPNVSENGDDQSDDDGVCCGNGRIDLGEDCDTEVLTTVTCPNEQIGRPICNNVPFGNPNFDGTCTVSAEPAGCETPRICYSDDDGDGFVGTERTIPETQQCADFKTGPSATPWGNEKVDCLDNPVISCAADTYPGAPEVCDQCDNDCDSSTPNGLDDPMVGQSCDGDDADECANGTWICSTSGLLCDEAAGTSLYFADSDGDGCGLQSAPYQGCLAPGVIPDGFVTNSADGDDTDGICCPIAALQGNEICDDIGIDEDCDGLVNELDPDVQGDPAAAGASVLFRDADDDGCGIGAESIIVCDVGPGSEDATDGYVDNDLDQDDTDGICCGNGVIESGEECEDDEATACSSLDVGGPGDTSCTDNCTWNRALCLGETTCGDGVLDEDETCDFGADDVEDCRSDCTFCGDSIVNGDESCDGGSDCTDSCDIIVDEQQTKAGGGACAQSGSQSPSLAWLAILGMCLLVMSRSRRADARR